MPTIPENVQLCDNVVVMLQRRKTNAQRCSDVDATTSKLERWSNFDVVAQRMHYVATALLQRHLLTLAQLCHLTSVKLSFSTN